MRRQLLSGQQHHRNEAMPVAVATAIVNDVGVNLSTPIVVMPMAPPLPAPSPDVPTIQTDHNNNNSDNNDSSQQQQPTISIPTEDRMPEVTSTVVNTNNAAVTGYVPNSGIANNEIVTIPFVQAAALSSSSSSLHEERGIKLTIERSEKEVGRENAWYIFHNGQCVSKLYNDSMYNIYGLCQGNQILLKVRGKPFVITINNDDLGDLTIRLKHKVAIRTGFGKVGENVWIEPNKRNNDHLRNGYLTFQEVDSNNNYDSRRR